jgi:glyoxylase-like metal-dependent hydrolase (beta-lactamase superfamily II)
MKKIISFLIVFCGLIVSLSAQDSTIAPKTKVITLNNHLYFISVAGCNHIVSIGTDGVLLVDANYREYQRYLKNIIDSLGGKNIDYIVNTHWHFDHVGCNSIFGHTAKIISSDKVKDFLSEERMLLGEIRKPLPDYALPTVVFDEKYEMKFNGEIILMCNFTGGHTASDVVVYFPESKVIHIGDLIFSDMFPFVDIENGGNVRKMLDNILKLSESCPKDIQYITGHGRIYTYDDIVKYAGMLKSTIDIVKSNLDTGLTPEEIKKKDVLKDYGKYATAFSCDDWIEFICKSVKK